MVRIAVLSEQVAAQIKSLGGARPPELENIDVVWSGTALLDLKHRGPELHPAVLLIDLHKLDEEAPLRPQIDALLDLSTAQLGLVLYTFARRDVLRQVTTPRSRPVKSPVSLANLRLNMLSLLVKDALRTPGGEKADKAEDHAQAVSASPSSHSPAGGTARRDSSALQGEADSFPEVGTPRLLSPTQLGRLQETATNVRCECPNHLAELVTSLAAFEEYSKKCESHSEADAAMHARLYRDTSRARRLLEEALVVLCRYEGMSLS